MAVNTSNNGTNYSAYTSSATNSLGTGTQNSTVVTSVSETSSASINTIRFNDNVNSRTITIDPAAALTVSAGGILITNTVANHFSHSGRHAPRRGRR